MYDHVVIGGGILGLAVAERLTRVQPGAAVAIVEKEPEFAAHQTGRNSGVLHAGIYYRPGSLKARFCRQGRTSMVAFAREHGIPHEVCGKLIVATTEAQEPRLRALFERGLGHGLEIRWLSPAEAREHEPHVRCHAAIHVPETGIIDYRAVCRTLAELAAARGAELRTGERVIDVHRAGGSLWIETTKGRLAARRLISCAVLHGDRVARMEGGAPDARIIPFRGEYYELAPRAQQLVRGLIYPVPDPTLPFLGVHLTRMIGGGVHAGPNAVLAFAREGYTKRDVVAADLFDSLAFPGLWRLARRHWRSGIQEALRSCSKARFAKSLQALVPAIDEADLIPSPAGVRAQAVSRSGELVDDFLIADRGDVLHVLNAPSPAATSSLAIAEAIAQKAG